MDMDRNTAFAVLLDIEKSEAFSNLALNRRIAENQPQNQAFVRELVYGVLKYKLLLDYQLDRLVKTGVRKLKKQDLTLLRMGMYQLIFMDSVPEYAAVSETVQMAKKYARGRESFINAVLRSFIRSGRKLQLPDRAQDTVGYLSVAYSAAPWIVRLWMDAYGEQETEALLAASNQTPELCVRVNPLRTTAAQLTEELRGAGFLVKPAPHTAHALLICVAAFRCRTRLPFWWPMQSAHSRERLCSMSARHPAARAWRWQSRWKIAGRCSRWTCMSTSCR